MDEQERPLYFGEWIKLRRKALDLTQEELGRLAGCTVFALRKIESGERRPSKQLAQLLATPLQIPSGDRNTFVKMARGELPADRLRLAAPASASLPGLDLLTRDPGSKKQDNLPFPSTLLVGRTEELAALENLLQNPECRLLAITGLGGAGKTRLAIEASARCKGEFPDGVWYAALASLSSADFIVPAIASAVELTFYGSSDLREQLYAYLRQKQALIVLDNFEHLMEGVDILLEILSCAPGVKLLVTSRERLNLIGEWLFEIEGLPIPPLDKVVAAEEYSSYTLFIQSAQRVQANFQPEQEDREWIIRICDLIQGIPLGIILAAAWTTILSPAEIYGEIQHNLEFLTTQMRDLPERHRSLQAVLESSWQQLSKNEQQILHHLSSFRGGFQREAAQQIAGASLGTLSNLVGKCLLHRNSDGRYDVHELVRQFAAARNGPFSDGDESVRNKFCHYYASLLEAWGLQLQSREAVQARAEMGTEIDNLRQAWGWMVSMGHTANLARSLFSIWWYHELQGWFKEGIQILDQAAQILRPGAFESGSPGSVEARYVLAQVLTREAFLLMRCGEFERAGQLLQESLPVLKAGPDRPMFAYGLRYLGTLEYVKGNYPAAYSLMQESVKLLETSSNQWGWIGSMIMCGDILRMQGDYQTSYQVLGQCAGVAREIGEPRMASSSLRYLGAVAVQLGKVEEANLLLEESLLNSQANQDRWNQSRCLFSLGEIALLQDEHARAEIYFRESLSLSRQLGDLSSLTESLTNLGKALHKQGAFTEATSTFLEAFQLALSLDLPPVALEVVVSIAGTRFQEGNVQDALELALFALGHTAIYHESAERAGQLCLEIKMHLEPQQVHDAEARAQKLSFSAILAELQTQADLFNRLPGQANPTHQG